MMKTNEEEEEEEGGWGVCLGKWVGLGRGVTGQKAAYQWSWWVGYRRPKMNGGRELGETSIAVVEVLVFWLEGLLLYLILWEMGSLLFLTS